MPSGFQPLRPSRPRESLMDPRYRLTPWSMPLEAVGGRPSQRPLNGHGTAPSGPLDYSLQAVPAAELTAPFSLLGIQLLVLVKAFMLSSLGRAQPEAVRGAWFFLVRWRELSVYQEVGPQMVTLHKVKTRATLDDVACCVTKWIDCAGNSVRSC